METLCAVVGVTPASDELAEHALGLLVPGLLRCKRDRGNRGAHLQCQLGSVDAMAACTSGSVELGASHGIGHQVSFVRSTLNQPLVESVNSFIWSYKIANNSFLARPLGRWTRRDKLHLTPSGVQVQC